MRHHRDNVLTDSEDNINKQFATGDLTILASASGASHKFIEGEVIDRAYRLDRLLGKGGMGIVFACHHLGLGQEYAIKILPGEGLSDEYWNRFQAEAQALAKLKHPGIVSVYNMGIAGGQFPYYVMDLLDGNPLDQMIKTYGPMPIQKAMEIFAQVADALSAAHSQGIIHRDIKPSNLMLLREIKGQTALVKIVDFGIARLSKQGFAAQSQTKTGMIVGTPYYMSPEQCQGQRVDERSDVYSLGCTMFESLTGRVPIKGDTAFQTFMMHQNKVAPSLASACTTKDFPESLELAVARMLAKDPDDRYQTMAQLKHDLERIKAGKAIIGQELKTTMAAIDGKKGPAFVPRWLVKELVAPKGGTAAKKFRQTAAILAGAVVVTLILVGAAQIKSLMDKTVPKARIADETDKLSTLQMIDHGTDLKELDFDPIELFKMQVYLAGEINKLRHDPLTATQKFKVNAAKPGFRFPTTFNLVAIKVGDEKPKMIAGFVPIPPGKPVTAYFFKACADWPHVLDKFGPEDLSGLEMVTRFPQDVVSIVSHWKKLDELCFFNDLLKVDPDLDSTYEVSDLHDSDLPVIDQLSHLKSLGLCGGKISGQDIAAMKLLNTINCLKVDKINDVDSLLAKLPERDNLRELWFVNTITTASQLEPLTRMKNLQTLHIRRSKLGYDSLQAFKRMPALKHLYLDLNWSPADRQRFKSLLPAYEYELRVDTTYWAGSPKNKPKSSAELDY